jgi:cytochrome P450
MNMVIEIDRARIRQAPFFPYTTLAGKTRKARSTYPNHPCYRPLMPNKGSAERSAERAPLVPGGVPLLGHALAFGKAPLDFLKRCQAQYGDVFTVRFPGTRRTVLMNPFDYPAYLKHRDLAFEEFGVEVGSRVFGYGLEYAEHALSDHLHWQFNTFLRGDPLQAMSERMQAKLEERLFSLPPGQWNDGSLFAWANEHVFAAGTDAIFGDGTYGAELQRAYTTVDKHFALLSLGTPAWLIPGCASAQRTLAHCVEKLGPHNARLMTERRATFDDAGLSDQVRGHLDAAIMWAAQANTVSATFWTLLFLLRDPRARAEVLEEVRSIAGDSRPSSPGERLLSRADLKSMVKLDSAITEMNRLTSAAMVPRRAERDTVLVLHDGRRIQLKEGEDLILFPPTVQLDPEIYEAPHEFRFDRFFSADGRPKQWTKNGERVHFFMLPFGGGKSMCPGRYFAVNEFKITAATLLAWFDLELLSEEVPPFDLARTGFGTYPPSHDVPFRFRLRAR